MRKESVNNEPGIADREESSVSGSFAAQLIELAHRVGDAAREVDHALDRLLVFVTERRLEIQQLRLREERGQRIVDLVLKTRRRAMQFGELG
ncbi:MAG: hypothetical protein ABJD07_14430 [Gemmatimonadaceae bacterium]